MRMMPEACAHHAHGARASSMPRCRLVHRPAGHARFPPYRCCYLLDAGGGVAGGVISGPPSARLVVSLSGVMGGFGSPPHAPTAHTAITVTSSTPRTRTIVTPPPAPPARPTHKTTKRGLLSRPRPVTSITMSLAGRRRSRGRGGRRRRRRLGGRRRHARRSRRARHVAATSDDGATGSHERQDRDDDDVLHDVFPPRVL